MNTLGWEDKRSILSGGRYGITCTFWRNDVPLVVVGHNKADCRRQAERRMGEWDTEVWSTPYSIYNDLTGVTRQRAEAEGKWADVGQGRRGW